MMGGRSSTVKARQPVALRLKREVAPEKFGVGVLWLRSMMVVIAHD